MPLSNSRKDILTLFIILLAVCGLVACEQDGPECYQPVVVSANLMFQRRDTNIVEVPINNDTFNTELDTLEVVSDSLMNSPEFILLGEDSSLRVLGLKGIQPLRVPLNPGKDSIKYIFRADTLVDIRDTITFYYEPILHFISNTCGYTYFFSLKSATCTQNAIDSVAILNTEVTDNASSRNVYFYYKRQF